MNRGNFSLMLAVMLIGCFTAGTALAMSASKTADRPSKAAKKETSVAQKGSQFMDDASTTMSVKNRLMQDEMTRKLDISVKTTEGRVVLSGTVDTVEQIKKIKQLVEEVPGVHCVASQFKVKAGKGNSNNKSISYESKSYKKGYPTGDTKMKDKANHQSTGSEDHQTLSQYSSDALITGKVKASFMADDVVSASDITVETNNGVVTLTGEVDNQQQHNQAEKIAKEIKGVKKVENKLKISS